MQSGIICASTRSRTILCTIKAIARSVASLALNESPPGKTSAPDAGPASTKSNAASTHFSRRKWISKFDAKPLNARQTPSEIVSPSIEPDRHLRELLNVETKINVDYLSKLENQSIYILREAYNTFENLAMLWSIGNDSTVMLWLARNAVFGHVAFPLVHVDTT